MNLFVFCAGCGCGCIVTLVMMCLCVMAGRADKEMEMKQMTDVMCSVKECVNNDNGYCTEDEIQIGFTGICNTEWSDDEIEDEDDGVYRRWN